MKKKPQTRGRKAALLKNPKWEKFAQAVAAGASASQAYRIIKGKGKNANVIAPRMLANVRIRARVQEFQQASATSTTLTMQERREILAKMARNPKNRPADRIAAIVADAKLAGELTDRVQNLPPLARAIVFKVPAVVARPRPVRN
jgi:hypothetical protein